MQLSSLVLLLFSAVNVLALPNAEAAIATKKTTRTRTDRKTTKEPPRPTACSEYVLQADCTANRVRQGCPCAEYDDNGFAIYGTCVGVGVSWGVGHTVLAIH